MVWLHRKRLISAKFCHISQSWPNFKWSLLGSTIYPCGDLLFWYSGLFETYNAWEWYFAIWRLSIKIFSLVMYFHWCFLHPFHVSFNLRHILKFFFHTTNLLSPHCTMCLCIALRISKITKSQLADLAQFWLKLKISVLSGQKLSKILGENILIYYLSQMAILWQKTCWGPRLNMRFGSQAN